MKFVINDYFFYKIVCLTEDLDLSYVGSTCNWRCRKNLHKSSCNNPNNKEHNSKKYQIIRSNGGWENFKMIEIGFRKNLTLRQAEAIEEQFRVEIRANMNTNKCSSGYDTIQEYLANYHQENREHLLERMANYRQVNQQHLNAKHECEICGGKFTTINKSHHLNSNKHKRAVSDTASSSSSTED
mgnify:CR=1 FL=1